MCYIIIKKYGVDIMTIHDAHTHIFPNKIAAKATESIGSFYEFENMECSATVENLITNSNEINVGLKLVCSSAVTKEQVNVINDFIISECNKNTSFIGFAALHPDTENFEDVIDYSMENNLKGIKLHPDFQKFNIDDKKIYPMYKAAAKRQLPILFHMGDDRYDFSSPLRLNKVINDIPDLKVIAAHFGGYMCWDTAIKLPKSENLFFDTSSSLTILDKDMVYKFIDRFGDDKFMFGTDFPMWNSKQELERFLSLNLGNETNKKILHKNFENLFKLTYNGGNK